ncbi:MAG: LPS assembly protein LptD [Syntrophobacteraceae bacterium]|jgi:LPS-assembly protein
MQISLAQLISRSALILCVLAFLALRASPATADAPKPVGKSIKIPASHKAVWTIEADKLLYDQEKQLYEADGNVKISSTDRIIEADYASVNDQTRQADLTGKVTVKYGRNWLKGEHIIWNLDSETGWLDSGVLFFAETNFFVQGKSISKLSATEFDLKEGFVTSCNPGDPDWKIQFNQMKVTVGGTAWTHDASLWARGWPVAYSPILGMPVEEERHSGFLLPWAGSSSLNGFEIEFPYYLVIRQDMDATFYAHYLENRGVMGGVEYRINNPQFGKGIWMLNYLVDQADKSFLLNEGYPFQTQDRYWLRGRQDITLPWKIDAKIDVDYVSDRTFLQEFSKGSSNILNSDVLFRQYFSRGILYDRTSLVRESTVDLEKRGESDLLSMDSRYWENLEPSAAASTIQRLPAFSYSIIPKQIDDTPLYYTLQSSTVNYWRQQGDTDQRLDLYPRVYYPVHWGNYLDVEPSAGLRASSYSVQWQDGPDNFTERIVPDARVDMSTRLNKEFQANFMDYTAFQNAIRPEISYEYASQSMYGPNNGQIPQIDRLDENQARNGVRYGFSTFLTGKEVITDGAGNAATTYRELVRFRVFQFFNVQQPAVEDPMFDTTNIMPQGLSPVAFRLDFTPKRYLTLSYDVDADMNGLSQGEAQDLFLTLDSGSGDILRLDYEQIPNLQVNEVTVSTYFKAYENIYLNTYHDYSLSQGLVFTQGYGIRYVRGCWGVGGGFEREGNDNRFIFSLDLLGLGGIGEPHFFGRALYGESRAGYQYPESWMLSR